jgi:hypothetical protein
VQARQRLKKEQLPQQTPEPGNEPSSPRHCFQWWHDWGRYMAPAALKSAADCP